MIKDFHSAFLELFENSPIQIFWYVPHVLSRMTVTPLNQPTIVMPIQNLQQPAVFMPVQPVQQQRLFVKHAPKFDHIFGKNF